MNERRPRGTGSTSGELRVSVDRNSPVPLYHQLFEQLVGAIESGALRPGDTLEREDVLAERLMVARHTLRQAIGQLVERGLITRRPRAGSDVTWNAPTPATPAPAPASAEIKQITG